MRCVRLYTLARAVGDDPAIRDELLGGVEGQIERMQPLLDDLAQLHGQGQGLVVLDRELTRLDEWLPPILLPWRAAALEKGLAWQATIAAPLPAVSIDRRRMAQAVGNLLSNAVKYTPAGGAVSVEAGSDGREIRFESATAGRASIKRSRSVSSSRSTAATGTVAFLRSRPGPDPRPRPGDSPRRPADAGQCAGRGQPVHDRDSGLTARGRDSMTSTNLIRMWKALYVRWPTT